MLATSIGFTLFLVVFVSFQVYSPFFILMWLVDIDLYIAAFTTLKKRPPLPVITKTLVLTIFLLFLPLTVRLLNVHLPHIHDDEFITGYISAHVDLFKTNLFHPLPENKAEWVSQFPAVYFFLQKLFFLFSGISLMSLKASTMPYVFIATLFLFLSAKRLYSTPIAVAAVVLYSFFGISLYLETLSLHFISSTAVFMTFFYTLVLFITKPTFSRAALTGVLCGLGYLFYLSSFIAFPILFLVLAVLLIKFHDKKTLLQAIVACGGIGIVLAPFLVYMSHDFYITGRIDQVNAITGSWSSQTTETLSFTTIQKEIVDSLQKSGESLYIDDIGGHGGYDFGHRALLDQLTFSMFVIGLITGSIYSFVNKKWVFLLTVLITLISFITGMVLTIPPPAFHRLSLAFPFILLIMCFPLYLLYSIKGIHKKIKVALIGTIVILLSLSNYRHYQTALAQDLTSPRSVPTLLLITKLTHEHPHMPVRVAAFPGFSFEKVFYFFDPNTPVITKYHSDWLSSFDTSKPYLYAIIFPDDFNQQFQEKDPAGILETIVPQSYSLFYKD